MIKKLAKLLFHPAALTASVISVLALLSAVEGKWAHMPFVTLIIMVMFGISYVVTRRLSFSVYLSLTIICLTTLMSIAKFQGKGFDLHVYDFAFTGSDAEALKFLAAEFSSYVAPLVALLIMAIIGLAFIWWMEPASKKSLSMRAAPLILAAIGLPLAYPIKYSEPRYFYYLAGFNASSFYISIMDIAGRFTDEPLVADLKNTADVAAYDTVNTCQDMQVKPDIYVVLSESATNFERNYPLLNTKGVPENAFRSGDGKLRDLRVETFGGGTWVSNLSFMTGLSSLDFGWRAPYLTIQMEDRIKQSLPSIMQDCGYKTGVVMPMKFSFVNEGAFLQSIGVDEVLGYNAIGASLYNHRDTFYFDAAHKFIDEHISQDGRPLFMQVQTMFAHSPFEEPRASEIQFDDLPFTDDTLLNEHIRRVYIAQNDFHDFIEQRKVSQPNRPFVVIEFGDHQTTGTRPMADALSGGNSLLNRNSVAYKTHYSMHSFNHELDMSAFPDEPIDIAFLGVTALQAVGVPLTPMHQDLAKLRDICAGKFDDCTVRDEVNKHISRRIKSGLLTLPSS